MTTLTASRARKEFFDMVKSANASHEVFRVCHPRGSVVVLSEDDYDGLVETLELLAIPGFRESMKRSVKQMQTGDTLSMEAVLGRGK